MLICYCICYILYQKEYQAMKTVIAIPLLLLALNTAAACPVSHPREMPQLPDVAVASKQEMHRAQLEAEQYLLQGRAYLDCGQMNRRQYNLLLGQLETFSERYNDALLEYRSRSRMIAEIEQVNKGQVATASAE